jgi:hypothetical protein
VVARRPARQRGARPRAFAARARWRARHLAGARPRRTTGARDSRRVRRARRRPGGVHGPPRRGRTPVVLVAGHARRRGARHRQPRVGSGTRRAARAGVRARPAERAPVGRDVPVAAGRRPAPAPARAARPAARRPATEGGCPARASAAAVDAERCGRTAPRGRVRRPAPARARRRRGPQRVAWRLAAKLLHDFGVGAADAACGARRVGPRQPGAVRRRRPGAHPRERAALRRGRRTPRRPGGGA